MPDDDDKPRSERCETCQYWLCHVKQADPVSREVIGEGWCRIYPPVVHPQGKESNFTNFLRGEWPVTEGGDWCGEWRPKEGAADWRTLTLEEADLPYRAVTILERAGIKTLGEVMGYSGVALLQLPYFGETLLGYVRTALSRYGAKLRGD